VQCRSHNIVRMVKSRKLQCSGHVREMGETRNAHRILKGNLLEKWHLEHQEGDGRLTLRSILGKLVVRMGGEMDET